MGGVVLGEFEQLILLALVRQGRGAYGVSICDDISSRTGRGKKELLNALIEGAPGDEEQGSEEADEMGVEEIEDAAGDD